MTLRISQLSFTQFYRIDNKNSLALNDERRFQGLAKFLFP